MRRRCGCEDGETAADPAMNLTRVSLDGSLQTEGGSSGIKTSCPIPVTRAVVVLVSNGATISYTGTSAVDRTFACQAAAIPAGWEVRQAGLLCRPRQL